MSARDLRAGLAPQTDQEVRALLRAFLDQHGIRDAVVAVSRPGGATWQGSVGRSAHVHSDNTFGVASITKPMVATIAMQLVDEGLLTLDGPLPAPDGLEGWWPTFTLRGLLEHSSGLRAYHNVADFDPNRHYTAHEVVQLSLDAPADFAPGAWRGYSSSGYLAVGLVLEHLTGLPLEDLLRDRIFDPLGMSDSTLEARSAPGWVGHAAGGVWSTVGDLSRFATGRWGVGATVVTRQDRAMNPDGDGFGLGLVGFCPCASGSDPSANAIGHDGGASTLQWFPRHQVAVALVLSESMYAGNGLTPEAVHALVGKIADAAVRP